jgi:hypothetical protein
MELKMKIINLCDITPRPVIWLWPNRVAIGSITVIEGNPGDGKSLLAYDLAARVTTGRPMYNCTQPAQSGGVLLLQAEDNLETRVVPALRAAGADLTWVRAYQPSAGEQPLMLPDCLPEIERAAADICARLIIIDPITALAAGNLNSDYSIRKLLGALDSLAQRLHLSVIVVRHLNKSNRGRALYRGAGSIAIAGVSRSVLTVGRDPLDPDQRIIAQAKSNLAPLARSLAYRIVDRRGAPAVDWLGESSATAEALLDASGPQERSELNEAIVVLFSILGEGCVSANEVKGLAGAQGISTATLKRAKSKLGVESKREGFGRGSQFFWSLDDDHPLVRRLRSCETNTLMDRLIYGRDDDDEDDPADAWKHI